MAGCPPDASPYLSLSLGKGNYFIMSYIYLLPVIIPSLIHGMVCMYAYVTEQEQPIWSEVEEAHSSQIFLRCLEAQIEWNRLMYPAAAAPDFTSCEQQL